MVYLATEISIWCTISTKLSNFTQPICRIYYRSYVPPTILTWRSPLHLRRIYNYASYIHSRQHLLHYIGFNMDHKPHASPSLSFVRAHVKRLYRIFKVKKKSIIPNWIQFLFLFKDVQKLSKAVKLTAFQSLSNLRFILQLHRTGMIIDVYPR